MWLSEWMKILNFDWIRWNMVVYKGHIWIQIKKTSLTQVSVHFHLKRKRYPSYHRRVPFHYMQRPCPSQWLISVSHSLQCQFVHQVDVSEILKRPIKISRISSRVKTDDHVTVSHLGVITSQISGNRFFMKELVEAGIKENIKATHYWHV